MSGFEQSLETREYSPPENRASVHLPDQLLLTLAVQLLRLSKESGEV